MKNKTIAALILTATLVAALGGCSGAAAPSGQTFDVKRADLDIIVSTDGALNVPNNYSLRFGTMGTVQEILVQEGDKVKEGALLAFLDNKAQRNAIKTALFNVRTAANNLSSGSITASSSYSYTIKIPDPNDITKTIDSNITVSVQIPTCNYYDLPNNYPEMSAPMIFQEARKDLDESISNFNSGLYKDAGFKLGMAYFDIDVCQDLIATRQNPAALAGAKINSTYYPDGNPGSSTDMYSNDASVVDYLKKYQARLLSISQLIMKGEYGKAKAELLKARDEMTIGNQMVENTVHLRGRTMLEYCDTPTSLDFLQLSMRSLQDLDKYMAQGNAAPDEIAKKLYTSMLNLSIGNDVLQDQNLVIDLNSGFNWKSLQQYNLNLQSAKIGFYKAKQDIMNTVIVAPSDGTVVSVQLKKGYPLSAQDYSSRTAIQLVDTRTIKFTGNVDEIDIVKVKAGQKVKITLDAIPDKTFTGTVSFISPFGTKQGQVIRFPTTILLDPSDVELRGGLSATADIITYSAKNVLQVPISVIIRSPQGPTVMVVDPVTGQAEPRKVTLGKQSSQFVEVVSGLKEGDKVTVLSQKPVLPGGGRTPPPPGMPH
jgi:multidrug efflux pump subunit AcrA (membrane-fusion protein)